MAKMEWVSIMAEAIDEVSTINVGPEKVSKYYEWWNWWSEYRDRWNWIITLTGLLWQNRQLCEPWISGCPVSWPVSLSQNTWNLPLVVWLRQTLESYNGPLWLAADLKKFIKKKWKVFSKLLYINKNILLLYFKEIKCLSAPHMGTTTQCITF